MAWRESLLIRCGAGACSGIPLGLWLRVLYENRFAVDPAYWGRAATILLGTPPNTLFGWLDRLLYGRRVAEAAVHPPVFVLGIWRSGTTHLHNLLTQDARFAYPNNFQVLYPHSFLSGEWFAAHIVGAIFPSKRPQDNMAIDIRGPQEDEFAVSCLTGRGFPMGWVFPRRAEHYDRYITFRDAAPHELADWKRAMSKFVRKLTVKYDRPLVLKSPGHTGRIRLLLELFPDARFVHIHRDPFCVFRSMQHLLRAVHPWFSVQSPSEHDLDERIIRLYREIYDVFLEERSLIPAGRFHEISFADLEADPMGEMRGVYRALGIPDFESVEPTLRQYVESLAGYRKNSHPPMARDLKRRLAREWRRCFDEWGYPSADERLPARSAG
ncbi:MAG: sulfotransferase family protein [Planctomycetaceae bacterium]